MPGKFITFEGIDGAGKSTHLQWLAGFLGARGIACTITREPGGTELGERLREIVLHQAMHPETEALLMFAARREHLEQVIEPALAGGNWVICDRFTDATFAYQGAGRGVAASKLRLLEGWVQGVRQPDLTLLFDVAPDIARERSREGRQADRFEREREEFFERIRRGYLERAAQFPGRIRVVDAGKGRSEVEKQVEEFVSIHCLK